MPRRDQLGDIRRVAIKRLEMNLRAARITVNDAEIERIAAMGFTDKLAAFEELVSGTPSEVVPDYLGRANEPEGFAGASRPLTTRVSSDPSVRRPDETASSIAEAAARIRAREISSEELTQRALERIAEHDPILNSFQLVLTEEAMASARQADRDLSAGNDRGPLHGIPVAVKDLFPMSGTVTTVGSPILSDWVTDYDAAVVERLRQGGAVIVGKTRLAEFASSPGSNNVHYGVTRNPWNLDHDTGGSSSGSAAAVAGGLVFGSLGSDGGGSIRMPAAFCGIVGLKPTFGRISLRGAVSSSSMDHAGPMTRSVLDAALMLQVLAGFDDRDPRSRRVPVPDYKSAFGTSVRGLRIGVVGADGSGQPLATEESLAAWRTGLAALADRGATLVDVNISDLDDLHLLSSVITALESVATHESRLQTRFDDYGEFVRRRILSAYAYGPLAFVQAQRTRSVIRQRVATIFEKVDLISTPTIPFAAPVLATSPLLPFGNTPVDLSRPSAPTKPFNILGWPAITVPVGLNSEGLPFGIQFIGRPWDEIGVLRVASVVEADCSIEGPKPWDKTSI